MPQILSYAALAVVALYILYRIYAHRRWSVLRQAAALVLSEKPNWTRQLKANDHAVAIWEQPGWKAGNRDISVTYGFTASPLHDDSEGIFVKWQDSPHPLVKPSSIRYQSDGIVMYSDQGHHAQLPISARRYIKRLLAMAADERRFQQKEIDWDLVEPA